MIKCSLDIKLDIVDKARETAMGPENGFQYVLGERNMLRVVDPVIAARAAKKVNDEFKENVITPSFTSKFHYYIDPSKELVERYYEEYKLKERAEAESFVQDNRKLGQYSEEERGEYFQKGGTEGSAASPETLAMLKDFIKRIGVDIKNVREIEVNGVKYKGDNAIAQITQRLIQIVEGSEASALGEEAMHFAVEIIKQTNPVLFNKLLKEIGSYQIYQSTLNQYSGDPRYIGKDGKPDILKLKMEAIGKVLAETIIQREEGYTEKPELLARVRGVWWKEILNFIKSLIVKSGFDQAAMDVISGKNIGTVEDIRAEAGTIYAQKTGDKQLDTFNAFKATHNQLRPDEKEGGYMFRDKKVKYRPSDFTKEYYSKRFRNQGEKDEFDEAKDIIKQETGTALHADKEYLIKNVFTDPETGFLREVEGDDSDYISAFDPEHREVYEVLKANLRERLHLLNKNEEGQTRFLAETMVYNPKYGKFDIAGTIDLIAIRPNGKVSLLDWKFMDLDTDRYEDIPWYKVGAWKIQMNMYKNILINAYGIDPKDFEQTRMIPIKVYYTEASKKNKLLPKLKSIVIGSANVRDITEDYLLPVGIESESTGSKKLDELLTKLNTDYEILSQKVVKSYEEKTNKAEQLNALYSAIRKLQMQKDIGPLLDQARVLNHYVEKTIDKYNEEWVGSDPMSYTDRQLSEFSIELANYDASLETYLSLDIALKELFRGELSEDLQELKQEISDVVKDARYLRDDLRAVATEFNKDFNAAREDIEDIDLAEKIQRGFGRIFSSTPLIQLKAVQAFFLKENRALSKAAFETVDEARKLETLEADYRKMASGRGFNKKNYFDLIKKKGKNELIDEYNKEFYTELKDNIKEGDLDWIKANVDQEQVEKKLKERLEIEIDRISNKSHLTEAEKDNEVRAAERKYGTGPKQSGWLQYEVVKQAPLRAKWESEEFKTLTSKGNEPAKAFYDYILERNAAYREVGYLSKDESARTFLPWVRAGALEKLVFNGEVSIGESFLQSISVDSDNTGFGKFDPRSGDPIHSIPIYFTGKIDDGDYSTDLFKTMALYNEMAIKFKFLDEIEGQALGLLSLERNKKAINTSVLGKTREKNGELEYIKDNSKNTKLLENMINAILYGQKYLQDENFDFVIGKIGTWAEKVNKKLGVKIFPENMAGRQISFNMAVSTINRYFQLKTLGLSTLAPMSNFLGGNFQSMINAGKYISKTDHLRAQSFMAAKMVGASTDDIKKFVGALEYFLPLGENVNREIANNLSLTKFSMENIQNGLMFLMRESDKYVQTVNFRSFIMNAVIVDGTIVNAREYLRSTDKYQDRYAGTYEEREKLKEEFEKDVEKLIEDKGLMKLATIENGKFVIPGIERTSDNVIKTRALIQQINSDALGMLPETQKRLLNLSIYGDSASMFKNWIPRLVDVRFGGLKYNAASDAWEYGRMRTIARELTKWHFYSLDNLKALLSGNVTDKGINSMREEYEKKKEAYEKETGRKFTMTENEFMDLYKNNVKMALVDTLATTMMLAAFFALKASAPEDDEDVRIKNTYKFMLRAADKFTDELFYFYDPRNINKLISGSLFPSIKLITDFQTLVGNFLKYNYGIITGADSGELDNIHYVKYIMKMFPGSNQLEQYLPMALPELSKEMGIKPQSQQGFFR